jgi:hypothetical protein
MQIQNFNQAALASLNTAPELVRFVGDLGGQVAERANANAARLFTDQGGGGVGAVESRIERDDDGVYAWVGYPPEYWYMWLGELGTERQRPRPHVRPALFGTRRATGGRESAIKSIRQDKKAGRVTKRNRELAKARKAARRTNG